jgi:hypothetical protein
MNLNKKNKELLMYCALALVAGYLMCMYYPVHSSNNGYSFSLLEGQNNNNTEPRNRNRNGNNNNNEEANVSGGNNNSNGEEDR